MHDKSYLRLVSSNGEGEEPATPSLFVLHRQIEETEHAYRPSQFGFILPDNSRDMLQLLRESLVSEPRASLIPNVHVSVREPRANVLIGLHFRVRQIEVVHTESPQYWIFSGPTCDGSGDTTELHFVDGEMKLVSVISRTASVEQTVETVQ